MLTIIIATIILLLIIWYKQVNVSPPQTHIILKRGGSLKKIVLKKRSIVFFKPSQCSFSDHGLIDDSMTYIVLRISCGSVQYKILK